MASYRVPITFLAALLAALAAPVYLLASEEKSEPPGTCFPLTRDPIDVAAPEPLTPAERMLAEHLARRYMIPDDTVEPMVVAAHRAARQVGLDPLLLLAVIAVESSFNPVAESVVGAKGLMQIIPKFHRARLDELGGEDAVFDPESNIMAGAHILQEYVRRTGTLQAGLQFYNGAMRDESAQYARKVMAERERLMRVVSKSRGG
jgi:soluble lytic murein transglycosylase-like protein